MDNSTKMVVTVEQEDTAQTIVNKLKERQAPVSFSRVESGFRFESTFQYREAFPMPCPGVTHEYE